VLGATAFQSLMVQLANLAGLGALASGPFAPIVMPIILGGLIAGITGIISSIAIPSFDNLKVGEGVVVQGSPQNKALMQAEGGEMLIRKETLNQPTLAPNFGRESAMQKPAGSMGAGLSDADASRIGKAMADGFDGSMGAGLSDADASRIGKAMASNMRFETTVTNRQQQIIIDGALNPLGGRPITA